MEAFFSRKMYSVLDQKSYIWPYQRNLGVHLKLVSLSLHGPVELADYLNCILVSCSPFVQEGGPFEIIVVSHWFSLGLLTYALVECSFFAKAWRMLSRQKWAKWRQCWELVGVNSWCINCSIQPPQTKNLSIWRVGAQQGILVHQSLDVTVRIFPSKLQLRSGSLENLNFLMSFRSLL